MGTKYDIIKRAIVFLLNIFNYSVFINIYDKQISGNPKYLYPLFKLN